MQLEHTPGPWAVVETSPDRAIDYNGETFVKASNGITLASLSNYSPAERRANAHLIAAAPELLEALIDVMAMENLWGRVGVIPDKATGAAIAKATGAAT